ncbi:hypothetical protein MMU07_13270 [Aquiflexum sp. LQ15W]|uniref:hypothetical protein n=1 Tax=Cognataquiflexum nitidum TaxID=2922272 RepID=UPI001F12A00B|nr:hypothetical protein [Cognataquiflexum nitidum]MCH6200555.1 hypothetical protein [Cognataquiflexum nitidum]
MLQVSTISSSGMKKLQLTLFLGLFLSVFSFAQSERDRNFPDLPKNNNESGAQFESPESSLNESRQESVQKTTLSPAKDNKINTPTASKKENFLYKQGGEKDVKKEEISTLSFNLFLYIVDRFKED